jgi:hypothetical protein
MSVTISGANFGTTQGLSTVKFNGTLATPSTWIDTQIAVPVPNGATTGHIVVHVNGVDSNGVDFKVGVLAAIAVTPQQVSVPLNSQQRLTAMGSYSDGSRQSLGVNAIWSSSDGSIATVDATGLTTAVGQGQATIQAAFGSINGAASLGVTGATFIPVGILRTPRQGHTATRLPDGRVLIVGGQDANFAYLASVEIYDPVSGTFSATGSLLQRRTGHTATLLPNGQVLIAGGRYFNGVDLLSLSSAELYDPTAGAVVAIHRMNNDHDSHTATLLDNGLVLIAGGSYYTTNGGGLSTSELYDSSAGTFVFTSTMVTPRADTSATRLNDGTVLVVGGFDPSDNGMVNAEIYSPVTGLFTATGNLNLRRFSHTATLLHDGNALIAGGFCVGCPLSTATSEKYDPAARAFATGASLSIDRTGHTATLLNDGTVLVVGGSPPNSRPTGTAELFDPASGTFTAAGSLATPRFAHTATLLNDGTVLIVGGSNNNSLAQGAELYAPTLPPPSSLQITPVGVTLVIGQKRQFTVVDSLGHPRRDATWTVSDTRLATVTTSGSAILTAVGSGQVTLTATIGNVSGQTQVTISSGVQIAPGSTLWATPPVPGFAPLQMVQAVPTTNQPSLYAIQSSGDGTQASVQALTPDGQQLWQTLLPVLNSHSVPDVFGGLLVTEYQTCKPGQTDPMRIVDLDGTTGQPRWQITAQPSQGGSGPLYCFAEAPRMALRHNGEVIIAALGNTSGLPELMIMNSKTGAATQFPIPPTTYTNPDGSTVQGYSRIGAPTVDSDESAYVEYEVRVVAYPPKNISSTLYLLQIAPNNSTTTTQLASTTQDESLFPGPIIPDGQGGVLASWAVSPSNPPVPAQPYQVAHVVGGTLLATYSLPFSPTTVPYGKYPTLVLGENGTVFATDGTNKDGGPQIVSLDLNSGAPNWSYQAPAQAQLSFIAATDGNGLVAKSTSGNETIVRFDTTGNPVADTWTAAAGPTSNLDYFASDTWLGVSGVNASYTALAGNELLYSTTSSWCEPDGPNKNGNTGPAAVTINIFHVTGTATTRKIDDQVNNALKYWKEKAKLTFTWNNKTVNEVPACDVQHWGMNCSQHDISTIFLDERRDTDSWQEVKRRFANPVGLQWVFTDTIEATTSDGTTLHPAEVVPSDNLHTKHYGNIIVFSNQSDGLVAAHGMGHAFQLPHIVDANNLMCGATPEDPQTTVCPNLPKGGLSADQICRAQKGADDWRPPP